MIDVQEILTGSVYVYVCLTHQQPGPHLLWKDGLGKQDFVWAGPTTTPAPSPSL